MLLQCSLIRAPLMTSLSFYSFCFICLYIFFGLLTYVPVGKPKMLTEREDDPDCLAVGRQKLLSDVLTPNF